MSGTSPAGARTVPETGSRRPAGSRPHAPGFLRAALTVAGKDLRIEGRTLESLSGMVLFSLIVLVVFNFAFDLSTLREVGAGRIVPGILWTTFAFSAVVAFARAFQIERHRDSVAALLLTPVDRGALYTGKALANLASVLALQVVILPLSAVFFDFDLPASAAALAAVVPLHTVGLVVLGTLFGAVSAKLGRGEALVAMLLFPAASPLLISAVKTTAAALEGKSLSTVGNWLLVTAGFDVLYFLAALLLFEFVLED